MIIEYGQQYLFSTHEWIPYIVKTMSNDALVTMCLQWIGIDNIGHQVTLFAGYSLYSYGRDFNYWNSEHCMDVRYYIPCDVVAELLDPVPCRVMVCVVWIKCKFNQSWVKWLQRSISRVICSFYCAESLSDWWEKAFIDFKRSWQFSRLMTTQPGMGVFNQPFLFH